MFDQPLMILVWSSMAFAGMAAWYVATRSRWAMAGCILVVVGAVGLLVIERMVVTPEEQIRIDLHRLARDLETNDLQRIAAGIDPSATQILADVERAQRFATIKKVSIKSNLEIQVAPGNPPRKANATFNAVATLQLKTGEPQIVPRIVDLRLTYQQDRWLVQEYELKAPVQ